MTADDTGGKTPPAAAPGTADTAASSAPADDNADAVSDATEGSEAGMGDTPYRRAIFSVPIDVVVAVGQAQPVIGELLAMRRDTVLPLAARVDDPVQIMVGDRIIARGELEELGDDGGRLGVRLTEVVDVSDLF